MGIKIDFPERNDISKMIDLDREAFNEELIIDNSLGEEWYDANNFQWLVAKDEEGNALGYLGMFHISQETYTKLIKGEMTEKYWICKIFKRKKY